MFDRPISGFDLLHPKAKQQFIELYNDLSARYRSGQIRTQFEPFETYRYPQRQLIMIQKGTSKAKPFQSAHQYGLAVDFVPRRTEGGHTFWSWADSEPWGLLKEIAGHHGLAVPIDWDKAHVQHPLFDQIKTIIN